MTEATVKGLFDREGLLRGRVDFGEHGVWRHGSRLTPESLRVPLVIRLPGDHRIGRENGLVQQVDILPTLLELLELEPPREVEGRSLLPLFVGEARSAADDPAFLYVRFSLRQRTDPRRK